MSWPWQLPDGWRWTEWEAVARVASNLVEPEDYRAMPHIAPNHIEAHTGRLLPYRTVGDDEVVSAKHRFRPGQILYSKIRPYLGKVVLVDFDGLCSADMYPVDTELEPRYLKWWMLTPEFTRRASGQQARTVLPKINKRALGRLPVPVAQPGDQERIVEILDDHLSRLDAAADYLRAAERRLDTFVTATLMNLIPDVDDYPAKWERSCVGDAGVVELGRQRHPDWHSGPNMKPYLRVANVFEDRIDTRDVMEMHWPAETFDRFKLHVGDVLLNEGQTPELLGRPALYRGESAEVAFTNSLLRFVASDRVLPEFALLVFRRHMRAGRFKRESRITTNIAHLSASRLKPIEFPIPDLAEQAAIVASAQRSFEAVERQRAQLAIAKLRREQLRKSMLSAAFSGHLTGSRLS